MIVIEAQVLLSNHSARAKGLGSTSYASKRIHLLTKSIRTEHPLDNVSRQYMTSPISVRTFHALPNTQRWHIDQISQGFRVFSKCPSLNDDVPVHQRTFKVA